MPKSKVTDEQIKEAFTKCQTDAEVQIYFKRKYDINVTRQTITYRRWKLNLPAGGIGTIREENQMNRVKRGKYMNGISIYKRLYPILKELGTSDEKGKTLEELFGVSTLPDMQVDQKLAFINALNYFIDEINDKDTKRYRLTEKGIEALDAINKLIALDDARWEKKGVKKNTWKLNYQKDG
jgi:hypothetical protein